jgi:hypothetical protein
MPYVRVTRIGKRTWNAEVIHGTYAEPPKVIFGGRERAERVASRILRKELAWRKLVAEQFEVTWTP